MGLAKSSKAPVIFWTADLRVTALTRIVLVMIRAPPWSCQVPTRAAAIAEARAAGMPLAGIFSAYRPPAFGVGGFADKFHSLHTYGLAVDVTGIGGPGTPNSLLWHEGVRSRNLWNGGWWVHVRFCSTHCEALYELERYDATPRQSVAVRGPLDAEP
jgi:hypothetical protein